ncbi:MAG: hypothetical protein FIB01_05480 [Gemmatimonadetes bacterium]|nr:hypothetical protein [Gemmatimonadota bacterium]
MNRFALPDLPLWMWLTVAAIPAVFLCVMALVWVWALRARARRETRRQSVIAQFLAPRGVRLSAEDADREWVERALAELGGTGNFDVYWVASGDAGILFEYQVGPGDQHGYGYLARSPFPNLVGSVKISPRARWLGVDSAPVFRLGREAGEGWTDPEFHKRYRVVAQDAAQAAQVVTSRLQFLLLELPDVDRGTADRELVEMAVNASHLTVLGRKGDWGRREIEDGFPAIEDQLRLAGRVREAMGR